MSFVEIKELWRARQAEIVLVLIAVVLIGGGLFWWKTQSNEETKIEIISDTKGEQAEEGVKMRVDVSGSVYKPGVYTLDADARILDALEAAGGVTSQADLLWIDKYLNRSAKLTDGQKIYIPPAGGSGQDTASTTININTAGGGELESLPGIGPVTAEKIIGSRPYSRIEELTEKKAVTQKVFDQIKDRISVW